MKSQQDTHLTGCWSESHARDMGSKSWPLRQMETSVRASEEESRTSGEVLTRATKVACGLHSGEPHHALWLLLSKSAARKLDYDALVCPCEELQEAMTRCEVAVVSTLQSLQDRPIDGDTLARAVLPGPLGGHGLRMTSRCTDAHFFARTRATEYLVREAMGTEQEFIDNQLMRAAQERLRVKGVVVSGAGGVMSHSRTGRIRQSTQDFGETTTALTQDSHQCAAFSSHP